MEIKSLPLKFTQKMADEAEAEYDDLMKRYTAAEQSNAKMLYEALALATAEGNENVDLQLQLSKLKQRHELLEAAAAIHENCCKNASNALEVAMFEHRMEVKKHAITKKHLAIADRLLELLLGVGIFSCSYIIYTTCTFKDVAHYFSGLWR